MFCKTKHEILLAIDEYLQSQGVRIFGPSSLIVTDSVIICDQTGRSYAVVTLGDDYATVYGEFIPFDLAHPLLFDRLFHFALECYGDEASSILRTPEERRKSVEDELKRMI